MLVPNLMIIEPSMSYKFFSTSNARRNHTHMYIYKYIFFNNKKSSFISLVKIMLNLKKLRLKIFIVVIWIDLIPSLFSR